ncbi:MAG TPA: hypothetical protein VFV34_20405, partial [Blastocatellia bacterium]|nr:hypothetical protein [Blastocatellia bacterium]
CQNFRALYYAWWPKPLRRLGEGDVGRFYRNNRHLLLKELNEDNATTFAVAESNFPFTHANVVTKYLGKMFSVSQRTRLIMMKALKK